MQQNQFFFGMVARKNPLIFLYRQYCSMTFNCKVAIEYNFELLEQRPLQRYTHNIEFGKIQHMFVKGQTQTNSALNI